MWHLTQQGCLPGWPVVVHAHSHIASDSLSSPGWVVLQRAHPTFLPSAAGHLAPVSLGVVPGLASRCRNLSAVLPSLPLETAGHVVVGLVSVFWGASSIMAMLTHMPTSRALSGFPVLHTSLAVLTEYTRWFHLCFLINNIGTFPAPLSLSHFCMFSWVANPYLASGHLFSCVVESEVQ